MKIKVYRRYSKRRTSLMYVSTKTHARHLHSAASNPDLIYCGDLDYPIVDKEGSALEIGDHVRYEDKIGRIDELTQVDDKDGSLVFTVLVNFRRELSENDIKHGVTEAYTGKNVFANQVLKVTSEEEKKRREAVLDELVAETQKLRLGY